MMWRRLFGVGLLGLLSACSSADPALPTLAELPTQAPTTAALVATLPPRPTLPDAFTPTFTHTVEPSVTFTPTPEASSTLSVTPSATITDTPSPTATFEPTLPPEARPLTSLLELAARTTLLPTDFVVPAYEGFNVALPTTPAPLPFVPIGTVIAPAGGALPVPGVAMPLNCAFFPPGAFGQVFASLNDLAPRLGCPAVNPPDVVAINGAWQPFQNGLMIWLSGDIYVLYSNGNYEFYADTFAAGVDPETLPDTPPPGLVAPVRGFAKVWANQPSVRAGLGWGVTVETGATARTVAFQNGLMAAFDGRQDTLVLIGGRVIGNWRSVPIR
ncbi:hypothetical protein VZO05_14200 [Aggregatilineales bacterium SYSU G02658]